MWISKPFQTKHSDYVIGLWCDEVLLRQNDPRNLVEGCSTSRTVSRRISTVTQKLELAPPRDQIF